MSNPTPLSPALPDVAAAADERRHLLRLRELCDEVLASQRVAEGRDVMTADERAEARQLLADIAPRAGRRERAR
jgi:arginine/lysine/ornithine decarboxylase